MHHLVGDSSDIHDIGPGVTLTVQGRKRGLGEGRELAEGPDSMLEPGWESRQGVFPTCFSPSP